MISLLKNIYILIIYTSDHFIKIEVPTALSVLRFHLYITLLIRVFAKVLNLRSTGDEGCQ